MKLLTQIFLFSLIVVKIVLGSIFIYSVEPVPLSLERNAIASELQNGPETTAKENEAIAREEKIDLNFLIEKESELKDKEEELARKRAELTAYEEEINRKIEVLTQLRNEIRAEMARKKTIKEQELKHIIKAYSAMKPQKAASLIEKLDLKLAIELLSKMKGDIVGNILSFVEIEKAARISEELAKRHQ